MTESDMKVGVKALRLALDEATAAQTGWIKIDYNSKVPDEAAERAVYLIVNAVDQHRAAKK